jgi:hypothetical protein
VATTDPDLAELDLSELDLAELDAADLELDAAGARERVAAVGHDLLERIGTVREQLKDQAEHARDLRHATATELKGTVDHRLEELEPAVRRARIGFWQALRTLIGALLVLPRMAVRVLGVVADTLQEVTDRGPAVAARVRHITPTHAPSRSDRLRAGARTAAIVGASFSAGAIVGWVLARRRATEVDYQATSFPPPVDTTAPVTDEAATSRNGWRSGDVALAGDVAGEVADTADEGPATGSSSQEPGGSAGTSPDSAP